MRLCEIAKIGEIMDLNIGDIVARAKIERLMEPDEFIIGYPTYRLVPVALDKFEPVYFSFMRNNGIFAFSAVLEEEFFIEGLRYCRFRAITPVIRKQRRDAFRLPIVLRASVKILEEEEEENGEQQEEAKAIPARTINLSETGVLFTIPHPMTKGMRFTILIRLSERDILKLNAKVVWAEQDEQIRGDYKIAAQFDHTGKRGQIYLRKYILKQQIIERRNAKESEQ